MAIEIHVVVCVVAMRCFRYGGLRRSGFVAPWRFHIIRRAFQLAEEGP